MTGLRRSLFGMAFLAVAALVLTGCPASTTKKDGDKKDADKAKKDHDHPEEGPNKGTLAEWGEEEYHAEFLVDHDKKQATVYILDGKAKNGVPIEADAITLVIKNVKPVATIALKADPQKSDPKGKASRFVGQHDALGKEMEFEGEISGKVGNKAYTGEFKEKEHKDHKHDKKDKK